MKRLVLALGAAAALLFACTFDTPPFEEKGYLPCHADKSCDNPDCACLDGKVCVPRSGLGATLDPQKCQCPDGKMFCAGECADVTRDPRHCGTCDTDCLAQYVGTIGQPVCQNSRCGVACPQFSADCDNDWTNGCDPLGTFDHCADCSPCNPNDVCNGYVCAAECDNDETPCNGTCCSQQVQTREPHGTVECNNNTFCVMDCEPGYGDCAGGLADGCETLLDDPLKCRQTCQGPMVNCRLTVQNVETATCEIGICGYTQCKSEFGDCDGNVTNGCENFLRQVTFCGLNCQDIHDCTVEASNANGAFCNNGVCDYASCEFGFSDCNNIRQDGCETNLLDNRENCGQCNRLCQAPNAKTELLLCANATCVIPQGACLDGFADCDGLYQNGCEANLDYDVLHCRTCDGDCVQQAPQHTFASCQFGDCIFKCLPGWENCDPNVADCETKIGTADDCQGCGDNCPDSNFCSAGGCTTACAFPCPDNTCPNITMDVFHCGNCSNDCYQHPFYNGHSLPTCQNGSCDFSCIWPYITCIDPNGTNDPCSVDSLSDPQNCNSCHNACAPNQPCTNGVCGEPGPSCSNAVTGRCEPGLVCCTVSPGVMQCQSTITTCQPSGAILTCDGPEDCGWMERCYVYIWGALTVTLCSDRALGEQACSSNSDCSSLPDPKVCCPAPGIPLINTCQPGCGMCDNFCLVGECDLTFDVCGDTGRGICPLDCDETSDTRACCLEMGSTNPPFCGPSLNCPATTNRIQIECNDRLDCKLGDPSRQSVCCLHGPWSDRIAECVSSLDACSQAGDKVICASNADCLEIAGVRLECKPLANSGLFACQ
jgi:hypothetical protein